MIFWTEFHVTLKYLQLNNNIYAYILIYIYMYVCILRIILREFSSGDALIVLINIFHIV